MRPEVNVFVRALRDGKSERQAFIEFCWAKSVVPIDGDDLARGMSLESCTRYQSTMAGAKGWDAFEVGATDQAIADEFEDGLATDFERGMIFRAMTDREKPSNGDLMRAMSGDDRAIVAELFGPAAAARMLVSR